MFGQLTDFIGRAGRVLFKIFMVVMLFNYGCASLRMGRPATLGELTDQLGRFSGMWHVYFKPDVPEYMNPRPQPKPCLFGGC